MKTVCTACGKKYNVMKSDGICPYCGMHASDTQLAEAADNDRVKGSTVSEVMRSYLNERLRRQRKLSPLRKKSVQIPLCIFLSAIIAGIFVWGNFRYRSRLEYYTSRRDTASVQTEKHSAGDSIILVGGTDTASVQVRVLGCKARPDLQGKVEGDFRIIELDYEDQGSEISVRLSEAYLQSENGCTVRALDKFDIMELTGMTEEEYQDSEYRDGIFSTSEHKSSRHKVLFAAPAAETEHTILMFRHNAAYLRDRSLEMRYAFRLREAADL